MTFFSTFGGGTKLYASHFQIAVKLDFYSWELMKILHISLLTLMNLSSSSHGSLTVSTIVINQFYSLCSCNNDHWQEKSFHCF